ncbi:MAG: CoA pyrophosphatase [Solirubrobacterales bacterium]|nr:MAG: CoA pyrophosphatase [Solirubrobacterales bacterium]
MSARSASILEGLRRVLLAPDPAVAPALRGPAKAAVLVPLYIRDDQLHVVLTRRRDDLRRHPGEMSFPGGRWEQGDHDLRATALREAHEEIGLQPAAIEIVGALRPTATITTGYRIHPFVAVIEPPRAWALSASEVAAVIELPLPGLRAAYARRVLIGRGLPVATDTYLAGEQLIWGATARILTDLFGRIAPAAAPPSESAATPAHAWAQPFSIGTSTRFPHSVHDPS